MLDIASGGGKERNACASVRTVVLEGIAVCHTMPLL